MPEGDTVWRTAGRLNAALAGEPLTTADLRWPSLATADLTGATTIEVVPRGKHILHRLDSGLTLHSHLRMEGQWAVHATGTPSAQAARRADVRAVVGSEQWTAVGRRLGMLDLVRTADEHTLVGHLGPDILGPDWDVDAATANVLGSGTTVGAGLLDQRNLAGLGTLWASEMLFAERLNPWSPTTDAPPGLVPAATAAEVRAVLTRAHRTMKAGLPHAMQAPTGIRREGSSSAVHGRSGRPCRRCGDTVRVAEIGREGMERTMFYCPTCQGGLAPNDDGRPIRPLGSTPGRDGNYRRR